MPGTSKTVVVERIALIIATIVAIVFIYLYFKETPAIYDNELIESRYKTLEIEFVKVRTELEELKVINVKRSETIDSLEMLKPKIEYVYIEKSKEIDNAHSNSIVNEFTSIFTDNGIE